MKKIGKSKFFLLPALSILMLLAGYWYLTVSIVKSKSELEQLGTKKEKLNSEIALLTVKLDSFTALWLDAAKKSNDTLTVEKIVEFNADTRTEMNIINSQFLDIHDNEPVKKVYIQVNNMETAQKMEKIDLINRLEDNGYRVLGGYDIEEGRANNQLRYFHKEDLELVNQLNEQLLQIDSSLRLDARFVRKYESKAPKGQVELWIK